MEGFLDGFNIWTVAIGLQIVAERETYRHIWVAILQPEEIFPAYPSVLVIEATLKRLDKGFRHHGVDVVDMDMRIAATEQCAMAHGRTSAKEVEEVVGARQK